MYISVGENDPGQRTNDWAPPPTDDQIVSYYSYHWLVQLPYDQKRVSLGDPATAVEAVEGEATPKAAALGDAFPNPFNPETTIRFSLPWEAPVSVKVFNTQGQFVVDLVDESLPAGNFEITWDGKDADGVEVSSGVYVYKIEAPNLSLSKKVTFLK